MKKALIALAIAGFASTAMAQIAGSKHDLNKAGAGYNGAIPQVGSCQFCHAPHYGNTSQVTGGAAGQGAVSGFGQMPLWNRSQPSTVGYATRTPISGSAVNLGAGSFTCLSCHDGVSDLGALYRGQGFTTTGMTIGNGALIPANVGLTYAGGAYVKTAGVVDLRDDHPVGVVYNGGSTGFQATLTVDNGTPTRTLRLYANAFGAGVTVECGSCHDPHQQWPTGVNFLRLDPSGTKDLCAVCHLK
jgi:hypothetical protein